MNNIYILRHSQFPLPHMNTSDIPFLIKTAAVINVNYPDIQKDTTTYITISNDVLNFYYIKAHHLS